MHSLNTILLSNTPPILSLSLSLSLCLSLSLSLSLSVYSYVCLFALYQFLLCFQWQPHAIQLESFDHKLFNIAKQYCSRIDSKALLFSCYIVLPHFVASSILLAFIHFRCKLYLCKNYHRIHQKSLRNTITTSDLHVFRATQPTDL